jgi:hypothetical protein
VIDTDSTWQGLDVGEWRRQMLPGGETFVESPREEAHTSSESEASTWSSGTEFIPGGRGSSKRLDWDKLRARKIQETSSKDPQPQFLEPFMKTEDVGFVNQEHFLSGAAGDGSDIEVLRRTVMMDILGYHRLPTSVNFHCKGQWIQRPEFHLVKVDSSQIGLPKPDLCLSFKLESFCKTVVVPPRLRDSIRPDSVGKKIGRCFPFMFFEIT